MKNFEYFEKEIKELAAKGCEIAVSKGKPCDCGKCACHDCDFYIGGDEYGCYDGNFINWLYEEHIEPPKISARTKKFFETIETGWVTRDYGGSLFMFNVKPRKNCMCVGEWAVGGNIPIGGYGARKLYDYPFNFLTLDFIKWEDEEPWSVEDILKLEVEDRT